MLAQSGQVRPAGDQPDVGSGLSQPAAEVSADPAGAVDRHPHAGILAQDATPHQRQVGGVTTSMPSAASASSISSRLMPSRKRIASR